MYRELLSYSTSSIAAFEAYSPFHPVQSIQNTYVPQFLVSKCVLSSLFGSWTPRDFNPQTNDGHQTNDGRPSCVCLVNCHEKLCTCLKRSLLGKVKSTSVIGFNYAELERCLSIPTSRILERHDYRIILDFF